MGIIMVSKTLRFGLIFMFLIPVVSFAKFPRCNRGFNKKVYYNHITKELKYCLNGIWTPINITGNKGEQGDPGEKGQKGDQGDRGPGITSVQINEEGNFVFEYGDGVSCTTPVGE